MERIERELDFYWEKSLLLFIHSFIYTRDIFWLSTTWQKVLKHSGRQRQRTWPLSPKSEIWQVKSQIFIQWGICCNSGRHEVYGGVWGFCAVCLRVGHVRGFQELFPGKGIWTSSSKTEREGVQHQKEGSIQGNQYSMWLEHRIRKGL